MEEMEREDPEAEAAIWNNHIDDLLGIRLLTDNWDNAGAKAPSPTLVDSAIYLAQMCQRNAVEPDCRIYATLQGTVRFQWQLEDTFCEIEVIGPFEAVYTKINENGYSDSWSFTWTKDDVYATRQDEDEVA